MVSVPFFEMVRKRQTDREKREKERDRGLRGMTFKAESRSTGGLTGSLWRAQVCPMILGELSVSFWVRDTMPIVNDTYFPASWTALYEEIEESTNSLATYTFYIYKYNIIYLCSPFLYEKKNLNLVRSFWKINYALIRIYVNSYLSLSSSIYSIWRLTEV